MKENIIARRYARGLIQHAVEQDELAKVRADLEALADLLDPDRGDISVPDLLTFLNSPTVALDEKIKLTDVVCEKLAIGKTVSDFLNVLIDRNRVALTGFITREFERISQDFETVRNAVVESARPLTEEDEKSIRDALREAAGCEVRLLVRNNPRLLGGVRVRMDDLLLDGSLLHRMERMRQQIG